MKKLTILIGLVMALALALPSSANASLLSETKKLTASDAQGSDAFGISVAISGDTAVAGALGEDAGGSNAGAAYVFERNQGGTDNWGEVKKLTASDAQVSVQFGTSVAISGHTAIVGALFENAGGFAAGAAYVFQRDAGGPGNWGEVKKLLASDAQADDNFGFSVAISGDTAIVGADGEGVAVGAAYVFQRNQGGPDNWGEVKKLTASDAQFFDQFGSSVAVSGDNAVVGAPDEDAGGDNAGAAYVFERDAGGPDNWGEVRKLIASDAQAVDAFGGGLGGVAVSGDTAIVGAALEGTGLTRPGAAYLFERNQGGPGNWGEVTKLTAFDAQADDRFGFSVALSGDSAVVGAAGEDAAATGAGAAYVFQRDQGGPDNWGEVKKLTASDAEAFDSFGRGVAVSGDTSVMGASGEDAGGNGAGAAYVFEATIPPDEQININVVRLGFGDKLEGTCWRISYLIFAPGPTKVEHDVVGDDSGGVKPDCGEPSNLKLFDKDPLAGNLRITITSDQRVQFGDIWHAQMSFSPISGGLDPTNYECDLSLGKCTIGPVAVGGLVVDLDGELGDLPLDTSQPSGGGAGRLAGTIAGIAALAVALTGAAWYARRRL